MASQSFKRMNITFSKQEKSAGKMSPAHLERAVEALRVDGYVLLEDIVSPEHLDIIRERMDQDTQADRD